jgi:hypothetical protein
MPDYVSNLRASPVRSLQDNTVYLHGTVTIAGNIASGGSASCDVAGVTCVYGGGTGLLTLAFPAAPKARVMMFLRKAANVDGLSCTAFSATAGTATLATKDGGTLTNLGDTEQFDIVLHYESRA